MTKNEELINAAMIIKINCEDRMKSVGCGGCPFFSYPICALKKPCEWKLPKPRRWTDTDILWAKAAKASGAVEIFRTEGSACAASFLADFDDWNNAIEFPNSAFADMKNDEHIYIDEILKEENQNG